MFPFKEDLCRFDFEVDPEDEYMCNFPELLSEIDRVKKTGRMNEFSGTQ
jgi:hypothetical protein